MLEERLELFKNELQLIQKDSIRKFTEKIIMDADDYFFHEPASSTGKYHPRFSLGDGGLLRHTQTLIFWLERLYTSSMFDIEPEMLDVLILAGIAHDMKKYGDETKGKYTHKLHPFFASKYIRTENKNYGLLTQEEEELVCRVIDSHMGVFGLKDGLPSPKDKYEKIVHLADYLAATKEVLDMSIFNKPIENKVVETVITENREFVFPFGKHAGKTLKEIDAINPGYLEWILSGSFNKQDIKDEVAKYFNNKNIKNK